MRECPQTPLVGKNRFFMSFAFLMKIIGGFVEGYEKSFYE